MKTIILFSILAFFLFLSADGNNVFASSGFSDESFYEKKEKTDFKIYPNPCRNKKVTVEFFNEFIAEIKLTNIAGKTVLYKKTDIPAEKIILQLENVPNGMYLVQIISESGKVKVSKLLVSSP